MDSSNVHFWEDCQKSVILTGTVKKNDVNLSDVCIRRFPEKLLLC
jgi:hypothetical protein